MKVRRCKKCNEIIEDVDLDLCKVCRGEDAWI